MKSLLFARILHRQTNNVLELTSCFLSRLWSAFLSMMMVMTFEQTDLIQYSLIAQTSSIVINVFIFEEGPNMLVSGRIRWLVLQLIVSPV